jgi:hypothetical protein
VRQHPLVDQVIAQWSFDALLVVAAMVVVAVFGPARRSREPDSEPSRPQPARSA